MNRNWIIFILVVATLIGSIWGSVANRKKIDLEHRLNETVANMKKLAEVTAREQEQVLGKTAGLQESIVKKDQQIGKARKELVALRRETQALEARLSGCNASVQDLTGKKDECLRNLKAAREEISDLADSRHKLETGVEDVAAKPVPEPPPPLVSSEAAGPGSESLLEQLQAAESTVRQQQQQLDAANAQIIGLEKMVAEKTDAVAAAGQELDRLRINMNVLLAKIADQQNKLQEMQDENRALNMELAASNEELAELRGESTEQPVQEK